MSSASPIAFVFQVQGDTEAKQKIQSVGGAFQNFGKQAEVVNKETEKIPRNFQQAALGMTAAAAAGASLFFQFDNLEKVSQKLSKAEVSLTSAKATLASAQVSLNNLVEKGITSGDQYQAALLREQSAKERIAVATKDVELAQGDMQEAQLQFALSVVPTSIGAVASLATAHTALAGAKTVDTGATLGLSGALGVLRTAMTFISNHPIILPLTALAVVFTLVATNAFGMRDALDSFAKKVEEIFPVLKPVFDFFRDMAKTLFPEAKQSADDMELGMSNSFQQVSEGAKELNLGVSNEIEILASTFDKKADSITSDAARIKKAMSTIGISGSDITKSLAEQFAETMQTPPPATTPAITTPPGTADIDSRITEIVSQLTGVQTKDGKVISRGLGGGMSLERLRGMGFQNVPNNEIGRLLRELDALEAEKASIEKAAMVSKFGTTTTGISGKSFAELVAQGKKQQERLFFSNNIFPTQMSTEAFRAKEMATMQQQLEPLVSFMNNSPFVVDPATMPGMFGGMNITIEGGDVLLDGEVVGKIQDKKFKVTLGATT